jgi:hypothetical protein
MLTLLYLMQLDGSALTRPQRWQDSLWKQGSKQQVQRQDWQQPQGLKLCVFLQTAGQRTV